jgi:hypothetical protein
VRFFREPYSDGIQFLLDACDVRWVHFGFDGFAPFDESAFPMRGSQLKAARLLVEIGEVLIDGGIGFLALRGPEQVLFRGIVLA